MTSKSHGQVVGGVPNLPSAANATTHISGKDWLGRLIDIATLTTTAAECAPFPYIKSAAGAIVTLLESIQTVQKNREDLKELAGSVVEIIVVVRDEVISHGDLAASRFKDMCNEFTEYLLSVTSQLTMQIGQIVNGFSNGLGRIVSSSPSTALRFKLMNVAPTSQYVVKQLQCAFFHGSRQLVTAVDTRFELSKAMEAAAAESAKQEAERQKQEEERIKQDAVRRAQQSERNKNMTQRERIMEAEAQDRARGKLAKFVELLSPADCSRKHKDLCRVPQSRSGRSLLGKALYVQWRKAKSGLLCCHGTPGVGKSVSSSVAIKEILQSRSPTTAVAYFYCEFQEPKKRDPTVLLASLLHQLLQQLPTIPLTVEGFLERHRITTSIDALDLDDLLMVVAREFDQTFLLVDGLDECENIQELFPSFIKIASIANVFITSRDNPEIRTAFKEHSSSMDITAEDIQDDVRNFVQAEVSKISIRDPALVDEVIQGLVSGAQGTFLWPVFHLKQLRELRTDHDIRMALRGLPTGMGATFVRVLQLINSKATSQRLRIALRWVVCSISPLTLPQLVEAVAVAEMDSTWDSSREVTEPMSLVDDCCNLLICIPGLRSQDPPTIQPFHSSVKDFLLSERVLAQESLVHYALYPPQPVHDDLSRLCLLYLKIRAFQPFDLSSYLLTQRPSMSDLPFASYAVIGLLDHIRESGTSNMANEFYEFFNPRAPTMQMWLVLYTTFFGDSAELQRPTPLHVAAYFNLPMMVLPEKDQYDKKNRAGLTPLHLAVRRGFEKVVARLLEYGANIDARDTTRSTALHHAVEQREHLQGSLAILTSLLSNGADTRAANQQGRTALHNVAEKAYNVSFLPLLLEHGADVNAVDISGCTPLHLAANSQKLEIELLAGNNMFVKPEFSEEVRGEVKENYRRLLEFLHHGKANPNLRDANGSTALHRASGMGFEFFVEFLLAKWGLDTTIVNAVDNDGCTALHLAVLKQSEITATCLPIMGADTSMFLVGRDVMGIEENGRGPDLPLAMMKQSDSTVSCLLKFGAKTNTSDKNLTTPLHLALEGRCSLSVVSALLDHGANPSSRDSNGRTPLHLAIPMMPMAHLPRNNGGGSGATLISWNVCREIAALILDPGNDAEVKGLTQWAAGCLIHIIHDILEMGRHPEDIRQAIGSTTSPAGKWFCDVLRLLKVNGLDLNSMDSEGRTPLGLALQFWYSWLKTNKSLVKESGGDGDTSLRTAYEECTEILGMLQDAEKRSARI